MLSILRKEVNMFFSSITGYIAIIVFLVVTGLFVWVFPGNLNIMQLGFASLDQFFDFAPLVFLFLIPAITMRSFAEEKNTGTIEFLATRPITDFAVIFGKYLAAVLLVLFSLIPTVVYIYTIYTLAIPHGQIDFGSTAGSYIGLLMIGSAFVSMGIFASTITSNQIVAFILGLFFCFTGYYAFDFLSQISAFSGNIDYYVKLIGMNAHYMSISRGVLDLRDVVYFISINALFLVASKTVLESRNW